MKTIRLCYGPGEEGVSHCVMTATSIVAGEPFTDRPDCVCPTISAFLIKINDSYGVCNTERERDLSHLPWVIIGTNGDLRSKVDRANLFAKYAADAADAVKYAAADADAKYVAADAAAVAKCAAADAADAAADAVAAAVAAVAAANAGYNAKYAAKYAAVAADDADAAAKYAADAAANADAATDAVAAVAAAVAAANADAVAADIFKWRRKAIEFLEEEIIPVYTTMTIEPEYNIHKLITK